MRFGRVQRGEVVEDSVDLRPVEDAVAETEEDVLDLAPDLRDQMEAAARDAFAGEGDVERLELVAAHRRELGFPLGERLLHRRSRRVQRHPGLAVAHLTQRELERALATE